MAPAENLIVIYLISVYQRERGRLACIFPCLQYQESVSVHVSALGGLSLFGKSLRKKPKDVIVGLTMSFEYRVKDC